MNNLKSLTNIFLVFSKDEAKKRCIITMKNWINPTDNLLKFRVIQNQQYISSMDEFYNIYLKESNKNRWVTMYENINNM